MKHLLEIEEDVVKELISNFAYCEPSNLIPETRFHEDLVMDKLDVLEMVMSIEREFNIRISDNQIEKCKTVGQLFNAVAHHL